ncbi:MAG: 50S ribosomal protein L17 [Candidatus Omnitrophota bacterium]
MRHGKKRTKLSMKTSHRKATMRNMARSMLKYQRIETTLRRAKEVRRLVEYLITLSKDDSVFARRRAYDVLSDRDLVSKLFREISPLFKARASGFTRIIPLGFRRGDGAQMAILELTEKKIVEKRPKKKKEKAKAEEVAAETTKAAAETDKQVKSEEAKKEEPKPKQPHKPKTAVAEEKKAERARSEEKKMTDKKGFMKNLRGFFRRKSDM